MSSTIKINTFQVDVYDDVYPIQVCVHRDGTKVLHLPHTQLKDLEYALKRAREVVRAKLTEKDKWEA